ncbi:di-trans,poly-cis-decaprenylcistransferase [bacterium]|nr:di-trans,poly-cis-decaprenylcistransferase [bacterium]
MDGNGRWAQDRGRARPWGHREGAKRVDEIVTAAVERGITHLTLYAFSTENWNRPGTEVQLLMRLLVQHLKSMDKKLVKNRVSLVAQGSLERLPDFVRADLQRVIRLTALDKPAMTLCLCLSYGGRQEIVDAARGLAAQVQAGKLQPEQIDEKAFGQSLYHPEFPDPDLLIRTGGEYRVSNFLLWQVAYAEFYVTRTLWPDFSPAELDLALQEFEHRERRFGKTSAQVRTPLSEVAR